MPFKRKKDPDPDYIPSAHIARQLRLHAPPRPNPSPATGMEEGTGTSFQLPEDPTTPSADASSNTIDRPEPRPNPVYDRYSAHIKLGSFQFPFQLPGAANEASTSNTRDTRSPTRLGPSGDPPSRESSPGIIQTPPGKNKGGRPRKKAKRKRRKELEMEEGGTEQTSGLDELEGEVPNSEVPGDTPSLHCEDQKAKEVGVTNSPGGLEPGRGRKYEG